MRIRSLVNILLFLLGAGILGLIVVLAGPSEIWKASKEADWAFTVSGLVVFASYLFVRSLRWHVMVKVIKEDVSWKNFMPVYFLNFMISNVTPCRSGEAAAPFLMKRHVGSETGMGFSVVIVDRILDFTTGHFFLALIRNDSDFLDYLSILVKWRNLDACSYVLSILRRHLSYLVPQVWAGTGFLSFSPP